MSTETLSTSTKRETAELSIKGMHCASCARRIEVAVSKMPGVASAAVNLATEDAAVQYDPVLQGPEDIAETIRKIGYEATVRTDDAPIPPADEDEVQARFREAKRRVLLAWALTGPVMVFMVIHMTGAVHVHSMDWIETLLAAPVLAIAGAATFRSAWRSARHLSANMDTLIALGSLAAFITGPLLLSGFRIANYAAVGAMIMAFHLTGRYIEARARGRASKALRQLLELGAKTARIVETNGEEKEVPIASVRVGHVMLVRPGEKIPTDGVVVEGASAVDEAMATGE